MRLPLHSKKFIALQSILLISFSYANQELDCEDRSEYWVDRDNRTCSDIAKLKGEDLERACNHTSIIQGFTAFSACCVCGGGFNLTYPGNLLVEFNASTTDDDVCFDNLDWETVENKSCDDFDSIEKDSDRLNCLDYGYLHDFISEESANNSCCVCGGGYRNGNLTGQKLRVGIPSFYDSTYYWFNISGGNITLGSIVDYTIETARSHGFGLYPTQKFSTAANKAYPNDDWEGCLFDVSRGNVDLCLGNFWESLHRGNKGLRTMDLYPNHFVMVSPIKKDSLLETIFSVGRSFTWQAWIAILCMIFYMGFVMNIVQGNVMKQSGEDPSVDHKRSNEKKCARNRASTFVLSMFYTSIRSFVAGDNVNNAENPSRSEQIITIGFVIFSLLTITAYTATAAAFMVNEGSTALYDSFDAVLADKNASVCIWSAAENDALLNYPPLWNQLSPQDFGSSIDLLGKLTTDYSNSSCNAVITTIADYEIAVTLNPSLCEETVVLPSNEFSFDIATIMFISPHLKYSDELLEAFNKNIINGKYAITFQYYFELFKKNDFIVSKVEEEINNKEKQIEGSRRLFKSIRTSSTSSTIGHQGEYHVGFCKKDADFNENAYTLSLGEMAFPLTITFLCSSFGLITYLRSTKKEKNTDVKDGDCSKGREETQSVNALSTFDLMNIHQGIQSAIDANKCVILEKDTNRSSILDVLTAGVVLEIPECDDKLIMKLSSKEFQQTDLREVDEDTKEEAAPLLCGSHGDIEKLTKSEQNSSDATIKKTRRSLKKFGLVKFVMASLQND